MSTTSGQSRRIPPAAITALRRQARLTQEQLAERAGVSVRTVRNLERGQVGTPRWDSVRRVARALQVPEQHLAELLAASAGEGHDRPGSFNALPPAPGDFTGRRDELNHCERTLRQGRAAEAASARIVNISGRPGVGKSALAVALAHRVRPLYPDGQLFVDMAGARKLPRSTAAALADLLLSLGVQPTAVPASQPARTALFRERSAGRRLLVLLDDARDEAHVASLVPSAPASAVVVTSRRPLAGLAGVRVIDVDVLPIRDSVELLSAILGRDRADAEHEEVVRLARFCAGLPLALRVAGAGVVARPAIPVRALAMTLADERRRLDELRYADLEVRATLELACASLTGQQRRTLALLGRLETTDVSRPAIAALTGLDGRRVLESAEALVDTRLVDAGPVDEFGETRYRFHDLIRLFAKQQSLPEQAWDAALLRVAGHWLALAGIADSALPTTSDVVMTGTTPRAAIPPSETSLVRDHPFAWFRSEEDNLAPLVEQLAAGGFTEPAWELAAHLRTYAMIGNRWDLWHRTHQAALASCEDVGDVRGIACMRFGLGKLRHETHGAAGHEPTELFAAAEAFRQLGDRSAEALALCELASWYTWKDELRLAKESAVRAVALARAAGSPSTLVDALFVLAREHARQSRWADARRALHEALALCRPLNKPRSESQLLWQLGVIAQGEGDLHNAQQMLQDALALVRHAREHRGQIVILIELAQVLTSLRQHRQALADLRAALDLCDRTDEQSLRAKTLTMTSRVLAETGQTPQARILLQQAAAIWKTLGNPGRLAEAEAELSALGN